MKAIGKHIQTQQRKRANQKLGGGPGRRNFQNYFIYL